MNLIGAAKSNLLQHFSSMTNRGILIQRKGGVNNYYKLSSKKASTACQIMRDVLFVTGFSFSINYYFFHGALKEVSAIATTADIIKLTFIFGMLFIMLNIFFKINREPKKIFAGFSKDKLPDPEVEASFFKPRKKRKQLCKVCLVFAIIILLSSAFLGFNVQ